MKKGIFLILVFISLVLLFVRFAIKPATSYLGFNAKSGIKVTSKSSAQVYLNDKAVGLTPYLDENLKPGEYLVKLSAGNANWMGKVRLNQGTLSVVNRELAELPSSASGEILTLISGTGATITSNPSEAEVKIDGQIFGKTPISASTLPAGEHIFNINRPGYLIRSIKAYVPANLSLNINVDLAISEIDLALIPTNPILTTPQVVVKNTPTGFLRVRDRPNLAGAEIAKVKPSDKLILLEELSDWMKVKLPDNTEGYVSSAYVQKEVILQDNKE